MKAEDKRDDEFWARDVFGVHDYWMMGAGIGGFLLALIVAVVLGIH